MSASPASSLNLRVVTYRPPMTQRTTKVGKNGRKIFKYISDCAIARRCLRGATSNGQGNHSVCAHSYLQLTVPEDFPALELPPVVVPSQHGVPACDANHASAFWTSWTILSHSVGHPFSTSKPGCTARAKETTAAKCRAQEKAVITLHSESRKSWPGTAMTAPHARQRIVAIATHRFRLSRRCNFQPMLVRASDDGSRAGHESVQCGEHHQTRRVAACSARWACFACVISVSPSPNMPSHVRALFWRPARP